MCITGQASETILRAVRSSFEDQEISPLRLDEVVLLVIVCTLTKFVWPNAPIHCHGDLGSIGSQQVQCVNLLVGESYSPLRDSVQCSNSASLWLTEIAWEDGLSVV